MVLRVDIEFVFFVNYDKVFFIVLWFFKEIDFVIVLFYIKILVVLNKFFFL